MVELLAIPNRHLGDASDRLGVVAVDVEDGSLNRLRDVGGVQRRAGILRQGRETDLVVGDNVNRSAGAVTAQLSHLQGFDDDTLTCHRRVAVHENRQHRERGNGFVVLFGTHDSFEHAVDGFEV